MHKAKERGRPREFDTEQALDQAMLVFRQKGFHAASMADLSTAMNLTAGSIYKAFTDKRTLFLQVFERYLSQRNALLQQRLQPCTTGGEKIAELLRFYLDSARELEGRDGCLVVVSATELQVLDSELSERVRHAIMRNKTFFAALVQQGQKEGSVSPDLNVDSAAELILCITFGMRVLGKITNMAHREETIKLAMKLLR